MVLMILFALIAILAGFGGFMLAANALSMMVYVSIAMLAGVMFAIPRLMKDGIPLKIMEAGSDNPLVFSQTRDGENIKVKKIDDSSGGLWSSDEVDYMTTEQASANMGGVPVMWTTENAGVGIPLSFAAYTQWLKQEQDIHDRDELETRILDKAKEQMALTHEKLTELKESGVGNVDAEKESFEDISMDDVKFNEVDIGIEDVDYEKLEGFDMQPGVRLQDFRRFMKQNLNPALIRAKIEKRVAEIREKYQGFTLDSSTGMSLFLMLIGIAIIAYVVMGGGV